MPPNSEGEQQHVQSEMEQTRQEVRTEVKNATTPAQKEELRTKIIESLHRAATAGREVRIAAQVPRGELSDLQERQAKAAAQIVGKSVIRTLEAVKGGIIEPQQQAKALFKQLADKGLTDQTATYLHPLIMKYIGEQDITFSKPGEPETQFEKDLKRIQEENRLAAELISSSLIDASQAGELTELSEEEIKAKFGEPQEGLRTRQELGTEASGLENLPKKIKLAQLNASQMEILRKFGDNPHRFSQEDEAKLQEALMAGGLGLDEAKKFISLSKRMTPEDYARSADAMLRQDLNFTQEEIEIVRAYFDNPQTLLSMVRDGRISQEDAMLYKGKILQIFNKLYDKIDKQPNRVF